jgi:hypothetical protein
MNPAGRVRCRFQRNSPCGEIEIGEQSLSTGMAHLGGRGLLPPGARPTKSDRRYPDNEQRIATPVCVEKWPGANERDPAYHRKAETIPRGEGSFLSSAPGRAT